MHTYQWTVVGAGPAGIAAVGKLLDNGVEPSEIAWIDPNFRVGDFGGWGKISSNTRVFRFDRFLRSCRSFEYYQAPWFALQSFDPQETCLLQHIIEPLQWVSDRLRRKVTSIEAKVSKLSFENGEWLLEMKNGGISSKNVVLAVGAEPKKLDHGKPTISLDDAFDSERLSKVIRPGDVVGVFGSSHSAILAVKNLVEVGATVINFYRSPMRYAVDHGDWILYDNTGLKGKTAKWARENIDGKCPKGLTRVEATPANIEQHLPRCTRVIYGVGFKARQTPIEGIQLTGYNEKTGVLGPGLFGCGIAYPEKVVDRAGNTEYNVGLWKFVNYLDRVVPAWIAEKANWKALLRPEANGQAAEKPKGIEGVSKVVCTTPV